MRRGALATVVGTMAAVSLAPEIAQEDTARTRGIRDNLALNVLMLLLPIDAVRRWQMGG